MPYFPPMKPMSFHIERRCYYYTKQHFVHRSLLLLALLSIRRRRSTLRVPLILGDTVVSKAIINCPVNYTPSRNDVHMLPNLPSPPLRPSPGHDRNELFNYHDLSPAVGFQSIMHDRSSASTFVSLANPLPTPPQHAPRVFT